MLTVLSFSVRDNSYLIIELFYTGLKQKLNLVKGVVSYLCFYRKIGVFLISQKNIEVCKQSGCQI